MQMNGSGIICTGYFYYNPSISSYSVSLSSTSSNSKSFSPPVSNGVQITLKNTDFYETVSLKWTLSGTYVPVGGLSYTTNPSGNISTSKQTSKTQTLPYVRYA